MSRRGKLQQAHSKGLSQRMKEDRISQLPDPLICQILTHLSTKEAVKTSVLSTRWTTLWLWLSCLEIVSKKFTDFNDFVSFGDRLFGFDRVSCLHEVKLTLEGTSYKRHEDFPFLTSWIDAAIKRKVQHLHLWCELDYRAIDLPLCFYRCETLVFLKLFGVVLDKVKFVSLPCLKTMVLEYVYCPNEATFERLVSGCHILEDLQIFGCGSHQEFQVLRVFSLSMLRLEISETENDYRFQVVIDAPLLRYLKIDDNESDSYLVNNLDSNAKLDISLDFGLVDLDEENVSSRRKSIRDFLPGISKVGEMVIEENTFQVFHLYSKLEPLPQFHYMSRLDATFCPSDLEWLPTFLECCPKLKSLVLALYDCYGEINSEDVNQISLSTVPKCLLSSLVSVDIKRRGYAAEIKLVNYFLANSMILKKLTLRLSDGESGKANVILKELLKISRPSATCEVVVL